MVDRKGYGKRPKGNNETWSKDGFVDILKPEQQHIFAGDSAITAAAAAAAKAYPQDLNFYGIVPQSWMAKCYKFSTSSVTDIYLEWLWLQTKTHPDIFGKQ
jgi:hypothetical protein